MAHSPWHPGKPVTLVPLGNVGIATQWVPYARRALTELSRQGSFRRKIISPVPGVTIHLETREGIPRITIQAGGGFWWWSYFFGYVVSEADGERFAQVVAADVPGQISQPVGPTNLKGMYNYQDIFAGSKWLGQSTPQIVKAGSLVRVALYEAHADLANDEFLVRLGAVQDNGQVQQPTFFYDQTILLELPAPVIGPFRQGPAVYPFLFATEWALLVGSDIGSPTATDGTLVRGRYPTEDDPTTFTEIVTGVDLDTVSTLTTLPGPNPGSGTLLRTGSSTRLGFGYWQGNGSLDPLAPPPPDPPPPVDRDFYFVSLVETVDLIPGTITYQQGAVVFRRSIDSPGVDTMLTSWLLDQYIQPQPDENKMLYSVYEYEGKLWVIFGRYVSRFPAVFGNVDRDWFFDQYVIDKATGVLLHKQIDCGIRTWAETSSGIYGYEMPAVTFTYSGSTPTQAHIQWKLRRYEFGTGPNALSLFPTLDDESNPIDLLSITTTVIMGSPISAGRRHDDFNHLILLQH